MSGIQRDLYQLVLDVQSQAIRIEADRWLQKQLQYPGGPQRYDFLIRLGTSFRKALLNDVTLSYPGHNGFSLSLEEYNRSDAADVHEFIENATDFGALIATAHTTKERDKRPRRKWYLFPVVCPVFDIPAIRTKEPYYATVSEVRRWIAGEQPALAKRSRNSADPRARSLFPGTGGSRRIQDQEL